MSDVDALEAAAKAIEATTPRMRKASLEYLWDRFVLQPIRDRERTYRNQRVRFVPDRRRFGLSMCSLCRATGHNRRTCPQAVAGGPK
jgi:hypothetical protein